MNRQPLLSLIIALMITFATSTSVIAEDEETAENTVVKTSYVQLKPTITTNYVSDKMKYVRTDIAVRVNSTIVTNVATHLDPIRDLLIMLLARQEKETLTSSDGVSALREEAKEEIIAFLESEGEPTDVVDVLFMSFLVE